MDENWPAYSASKPETSPAEQARARRLVERIEAIADKSALPFGDPNTPTFGCPDCADLGWIYVPCIRAKCCVCKSGDGHEVVRPCLSCELGVTREAGFWFRYLYRRGTRGAPVIIAAHLQPFEQAMIRLGGSAKRVQLALDAIVDREKAPRAGAA
jgi:RNase P subunit RPR2